MIMNVRTTQGQQFIDITREVQKFVEQDGLQDGFVVVYVPHTTAAVTINENGDPAVVRDIIATLNKVFPVQGDYTHFEGNSHAHIKASLLGSSCTVPVENGKLQLGTWQSIYFCEFDGPRQRKVHLKTVSGR
ncbi:MAG TPA: YjbQ family protein [Firmicutes bacterium]|jgi:secondary thiamine-phosphate synthase enzyme|nr:secondary thiamine-phosphate synthase enzyme YjbQ [Bacillota bacterium]HHT42131.1 YjbQ family protein [Bacillota bacterium]